MDNRAVGAWDWGDFVDPGSFDDYAGPLKAFADALDELRRRELLLPTRMRVLGWMDADGELFEMRSSVKTSVDPDTDIVGLLRQLSEARGGRRPINVQVFGACQVAGDASLRQDGCQLTLADGLLHLELLPEEFATGPLRARNAPRLRAALDAIAQITGEPTVPDEDARGESTPVGVTLAA